MIFLTEKLTKSILDPIHGLIRMTEEEMHIISHQLFNRLRKIKQNTFLYYVFPSANHTRFEHSIGVMNLASEMFINAFYNANTLIQKKKKYNIDDNRTVLCIDEVEDIESIFLDLRIAALLHDIGHGPMSHLFDKFAMKNRHFIEMMKEENFKNQGEEIGRELASSFNSIFETNNLFDKNIEHEYVSYYFSLNVLSDIGVSNKRIRRILTIMNGHLDLEEISITKGEKTLNILPLLNDIVAGAPLDCDRMDYLLRDSYFSGVKYGTYDLNRLLKSLLPFIHHEQNSVKLGIKKSGLPAIENFLQARYELFVQVYFHKTNQACNTMLDHATRNIKELNFLNFENIRELKEKYLSLSDEKFLESIYDELIERNNLVDSKTMSNLLSRKLWKRVLEVHPEPGKERKEDLNEILISSKKYILDKDPAFEPYVRENLNTSNPVKDLDKEKAVLLVKDDDENYIIEKDTDWVSDSIIFKALSRKYMVGRIYMEVDTSNNESKEKFRAYKKEIRNKL